MTVYLDQIWLLNTLLDYLLLVVTARFCGRSIHRLRFLLIASLGGIYAVLGFVLPLLHMPLLRPFAGALLGWLAFRAEYKRRSCIAVYFLLSAALAGLVMAVGSDAGHISWPILLLSSGVFYLLLEVFFRQPARFGRNEVEMIQVDVGGRICTLRALYDTGNTLRSPLDGTPVLVAEASSLQELWSREEAEILLSVRPAQDKVACLYALGNTRFSLLPYTAVGGSGLLLCMRSDRVVVQGRNYRRAMVALMEHTLGENYDALWGGERHHGMAAIHTRMDTTQVG